MWADGKWNDPAARGRGDEPWEIYHLEKRGEILGSVRGENTGTSVEWLCRCQVGRGEHPKEGRRAGEQDGGVDAEERVPAQYFHVPILEIECFVWNHGSWVGGELLVGSICDRGVDGGLVIGNACDCYRSEWRRLRDLRFEISVGKSQGRCDGGRGGIFLVRAGHFWFPGREYRRGREALPATLP